MRKVKKNKLQMNHINSLRFALLATSIALIILGVLRGEARTVLQKAILICLECIGIG